MRWTRRNGGIRDSISQWKTCSSKPSFPDSCGRFATRSAGASCKATESRKTLSRPCAAGSGSTIRFAGRFGIAPPIEVRYDEFTEDIDPNRLIKAAIRRLRRMRLRSPSMRNLLREFDGALASVSAVEYHRAKLPAITWTPLNAHYRPAIELAKLILQSCSLELRHGQVRSTSFLVDMNQVFEDFVVTALRETLGVTRHTLRQGVSLHLDKAREIDVRPDLSWWEAGQYLFVGDVKYKRLQASGIKHADLYQLLSYTIAADLPRGLLIYAAEKRERGVHEIVHVGKELTITTLDLEGAPDDILGQVGQLAERISGMKSEAQDRAA